MKIEKVKELLKAIKTDPEAQEALQGMVKPSDEDSIIRYYAEAAKKLGFALTEEDIREAVAAVSKQQQTKTDTAVGKVEALSDDELNPVAGGCLTASPWDYCLDTYEQRENCWVNDGCDASSNLYPGYQCEHNYSGHVCGDREKLDCSQFIF